MILFPVLITSVSSDKKKILIIEDNIETQLIFKVYLREKYSVEIAGNAEKGIELLTQSKFDLVLLDINLPGKWSGEDVLKEARKIFNNEELPIIVITAYALRGDREKFLRLGANDYLSKPVEKAALLEEIRKYVTAG